ncbi:hypothetical protein Taro_017097 [Colocasia esculenta]|uniref:Uncharacterized protein n=1 Tax=Colocasia esculenta TaxID=4460 RepID=A0A843UM99_COLES|nr:hypothetical protein [Colocasia esculenta]
MWSAGSEVPSYGAMVGRGSLGETRASKISTGRVEEFLATGEAGDPHTKPFFFPIVSAATCTDHHLEVDQGALVSTLLELVSTHCPSTAQKASSVDTTWASVDTLSQIGQKVFWELSLVSTPPELVSTLLDQFIIILPCVWSIVSTPVRECSYNVRLFGFPFPWILICLSLPGSRPPSEFYRCCSANLTPPPPPPP